MAHFLTHRLRPAGVMLILLVPASWLLMPLHSLGPMFQVRGVIFAMLGVGFLWVLLRRGKAAAKRTVPRLASVGEEVSYRVEVTNTGGMALRGASLLEMAPDARPSLALFAHSREPEENERNLFDRTLAYHRWEWLQGNLTKFSQEKAPQLADLAPGETGMVTLSLKPHRRGVIPLQDLRLCLPDPLGLFQRCRRVAAPNDKLIVLPRRYRLPPLALEGSARFQIGGETASSTVGQSGDFTGVREYRPGDPIRHIHWKSWARTAKPIVKEYEDVFFPRYGLVLDTFATGEQAELFEEAVSVAASFAASIDTQESLLDLMFIRDEAYIFSAGRGEERVDRMLEVLAGVQCDPLPDFEALQKLVMKHSDDLTACIFVMTGWCEQRRDTVTRLHRSGTNLKVLSVCANIENTQELLLKHPSPVPVKLLRQGHVQDDLIARSTT